MHDARKCQGKFAFGLLHVYIKLDRRKTIHSQ